MNLNHLKDFLEKVCYNFDYPKRLLNDPVEFPHRYREKEDIEVAGFLSALFAYGRVELFKPVIERILNIMGRSPYDFILNFSPEKKRLFRGIYYRFQKEEDIINLIKILNKILKKYINVENAFYTFYSADHEDTSKAIEAFSRYCLSVIKTTNGVRQLFPLPSNGSACKRMNLFLRWMVRKDEVDLGIWKGIPKNKLIIPLDVHIARIALKLGLTKRKTPDMKMAKEITEVLKRLDPDDPLRYDFALCHTGMMTQVRR
ncbi:MAG: TIGR02757 family protein [Thermodesulfovibrionales bacterium]|nr:TIGR02757 family protein [Thermodesulfovibrionales bacterium]